METKFEIIPIFPTPLYINQIPKELILDYTNLLNNEEILDKNIPTTSRSKDTYLLNKPQYNPLSSYILQHATNFAENYLMYNYEDYKFSQSWISLKYPNESHNPHTHPHSLISGVLFYDQLDSESSPLKFHREDDYSKSISINKSQSKNLNNFSFLSFDISPTPFKLILFPSYLAHSVPENTTNKVRKSLAFNIVPKGGFGHKESLTELKFN